MERVLIHTQRLPDLRRMHWPWKSYGLLRRCQMRYFAVGDEAYETDLVDTTWEALQKALSKYVQNTRPAKGRRPTSSDSVDYAKVREWARANNKSFNEKGRLTATLVDDYKAAHA
jgi:Lsr2